MNDPRSTDPTPGPPPARRAGSRIPDSSWFYRRALPALLVLMGIVTLGLILTAAGVLVGLVPWR